MPNNARDDRTTAVLVIEIADATVEDFARASKQLGDFIRDVPENTTWAGSAVRMYGAIEDAAARILAEFHDA